MHNEEMALAESERRLRQAGADRVVDEIQQRARRFTSVHDVELAAIREQHLTPRMRAVHLMVVFVWIGTAVMIASELARYSAGGHRSQLGVSGAVLAAALGVLIVIVLGPRPLCKTRRNPLLWAACAMLLIALLTTQGTSADWSPRWYMGTALVLLLCWTMLTVVRGFHRDQLPVIDQDLVEISTGLRADLEAELNQVPAVLNDGAPLGIEADRVLVALVKATVEQVTPIVPGSDWKARSRVTAA